MENPAIIGALIAAMYAIVELSKFVMQRARSSVGFTATDRDELKDVCDILRRVEKVTDESLKMQSHFDQDGIPLWYTPREWVENQKELLKESRKTNERLGEVVSLLKIQRLPASENK